MSNVSVRRNAVRCGLLSLLFAGACGPATQGHAAAPLAVKAPDFIGTSQDWLNSPPLSIAELRGKVVLVDFWEYTCVNCIRTYPYLKAWWERYKDKGLVIVGIHTPEFKFAATRQNVADSAAKYGLTYPILIDSEYKNWNAWNNNYWPAKYLIDANGNVVGTHFGEGDYAETELAIQRQLKLANPSVVLPPILPMVRNEDKPGAVCYPFTAEMYAGERGLEEGQFGYRDRPLDKEVSYRVPSEMQEGVFYLGGPWKPEDQFLAAIGRGSQLALHYKAKEANIVLKTTQASTEVEVLQDGAPLKKEDAGDDIHYVNGRAYLVVEEPRMYNVVKNRTWGKHRLDFMVLEPGLQVYSMTFTSECQ